MITVARLRAILEHFDDDAAVYLTGCGKVAEVKQEHVTVKAVQSDDAPVKLSAAPSGTPPVWLIGETT
jgi:hypothetical protein